MESLKSRLGYRFASVGELLTQRTLRYARNDGSEGVCNDGMVTFCHCEIPLVESWRALRKASHPL